MTMLNAVTTSNLNKQGFGNLNDAAKSRYALPLRFTPGVGTILIVIGLILQSPVWLGAMALVALSGAVFPSGMLIDLVYNLGIRHLFHAPPLPPTPKPRQFSYDMLDGVMALWFGLTAISVIYVVVDIQTTPESPVLKWGFALLT